MRVTNNCNCMSENVDRGFSVAKLSDTSEFGKGFLAIRLRMYWRNDATPTINGRFSKEDRKKKLQQQSTIKQTLQLSVIRVINGPNALALCDIIYLFEYKCQSGALISFNKSPDFIYFSITLALSSSFLPQCFRRPQIVAAYSTLAYHFWRFRRFLPMQSRNWTGVTRRFVRMASGMWRVITMV